MKLIVDANELFSAIIAKGRGKQTKKLDLLFSDDVELFSPALLFRELEKNRELIKRKAGFSDQDIETLTEILKLRINVILIDTLLTTCQKWAGGPLVKDQRHARFARRQPVFEHTGIPPMHRWFT